MAKVRQRFCKDTERDVTFFDAATSFVASTFKYAEAFLFSWKATTEILFTLI